MWVWFIGCLNGFVLEIFFGCGYCVFDKWFVPCGWISFFHIAFNWFRGFLLVAPLLF